MHPFYPIRPILLDLITLTRGDEYKLWNSLHNFLPLRPLSLVQIFFSAPCSQIPSMFCPCDSSNIIPIQNNRITICVFKSSHFKFQRKIKYAKMDSSMNSANFICFNFTANENLICYCLSQIFEISDIFEAFTATFTWCVLHSGD
jgi:hypothetical protein